MKTIYEYLVEGKWIRYNNMTKNKPIIYTSYTSKLTSKELEDLMVKSFSSITPTSKSKVREMLRNYRKSIKVEMTDKLGREFLRVINGLK